MEAWPDENLKVKVKYLGEEIHLVLVIEDQLDTMNNGKMYAEVFFKLIPLCKEDELEQWYPLFRDGKYLGDVKLKSDWKEEHADLDEM